MNREQVKKLFDAITEIRDELIEQGQETDLKTPRFKWRIWGAAAACLMAVAGLGLGLWHSRLLPGGCTGAPFESYAGPVFPLTLAEPRDSVTAKRHLVYDLAQTPDDIQLHFRGAHVRDNYILSNNSDQEQHLTALYPFAGNFDELDKLMPHISVDGAAVQPALRHGSSGAFAGAQEMEAGWESYKTLLGDGTYLQGAFTPYPRLDQKVTVYEFSDFNAPLEKYPAATQAISFNIDQKRTVILHFGLNGIEWGDHGFRRYSYFVPPDESMLPETKMLIVIGDDIDEYALQGYKNGACEKGNKLEGVQVSVTRYETVLSDIVDHLVAEFFTYYREGAGLPAGISHEIFCGAMAQLLCECGLLSGSATGCFGDGCLEDIIVQTNVMTRLFYLEFSAVIPPGESISVVADLRKMASHDYPRAGSKNLGVQGYDLVTRLGSNLRFDQIAAEITSNGDIIILEQNFNFDLPGSVNRVTLDPACEHYYLVVQ